ncbi:glycoside hydrolase family 88 protein [Psychrosphaera sp. B3R10]|uniref:glycoside hydrolase family 88 protein n=1 Tax=unclassified Psychrosphaera TaxID=2641570 RepID=UPI001C09109E|nr:MULTISPECIES: glycoside hydrolase family 88 protein [unclassified Psychrosphaera]MBU2881677.1 glycoside hydrolase family 88 protein [Psychrosphaera sp. I2R16]MBU2991068.1 glycoside hydrolase family 88 protein [Psychrosphaera sp. B3R10]
MTLEKRSKMSLMGISTLTLLMGCSGNSTMENSEKHDDSKVATAEVHNPSTFDRPDESIYFSYYDLGLPAKFNKALVFKRNDQVLNTQAIDSDFDGSLDGVVVLTSMASRETFQLDAFVTSNPHITAQNKRTQAEISQKEGGKWQPHSRYPNSKYQEYVGGDFVNVDSVTLPPSYNDHSFWLRYEGPGIESDKVGYRVYLDWRNGFDIFGKLTEQPILQNVGLDGYDSYHEKQSWGMDILKVGDSLGSGGFGLWHDNSVERITKADTRGVTIDANGDVYSAFTINYGGWQSAVGKQDLAANISMSAGSHLANVTLNFETPIATMAAGIVKHKNTELITGDMDITGKAYTYIASWGPQSLDGSNLGMAVFFRKEMLKEVTTDKHNYLAILTPKGNSIPYNKNTQQLDYSFAALWQPESGIATKQAFEVYLKQQAERLTVKPRIRLKTKLSDTAKQSPIDAEVALSWAKKLADSELNRKSYTYEYDGWDVNRRRLPKFEYDIVGLYPHTLNKITEITGDKKYQQALHRITGSFIDADGGIKRYKISNYNIDAVAPGRAVLKLYQLTKDEKYKKAAALIRQQLVEHPKTVEGAFWHKKKYTSQLWLDGVYMGMPFLAEYSNMFEDGHSLDEVIKEFTLTYKYLRDANTGNYYHAWDEQKQQDWADKNTGLSPEFWARGMGWLAMALVDVLELIDESETELRAPLVAISNDLAKTLKSNQDATGTWWQVIDKPGQVGNYRESSASAMFTYFLAKAIDKNIISNQYLPMTKLAYEGLTNEFILVHDNGEISLTNICYVAGLGFGRDGSYQYYMNEPVAKNDPKGTVPFMLASLAMYELLK